jgi:hypothetical protein
MSGRTAPGPLPDITPADHVNIASNRLKRLRIIHE